MTTIEQRAKVYAESLSDDLRYRFEERLGIARDGLELTDEMFFEARMEVVRLMAKENRKRKP